MLFSVKAWQKPDCMSMSNQAAVFGGNGGSLIRQTARYANAWQKHFTDLCGGPLDVASAEGDLPETDMDFGTGPDLARDRVRPTVH